MNDKDWKVVNPSGSKRVVVTKQLAGERWLEILTAADCSVEICMSTEVLTIDEIRSAMGSSCDGAIGQLQQLQYVGQNAGLINAGFVRVVDARRVAAVRHWIIPAIVQRSGPGAWPSVIVPRRRLRAWATAATGAQWAMPAAPLSVWTVALSVPA